MEKTAYRLLKALYKKDMTRGEADSFVGIKDDHILNRYTSFLAKEGLIDFYSIGESISENGTVHDGVQYWRITILGSGYIEQRRKDLLMFWVPYAITTAIAVAALID